MKAWMRLSVATSCLVTMGAGVAVSQEPGAPPAQSFEQLQSLVKLGDEVSVTDATGVVTKGRIAELTPSVVRLRVNSTIRDLPESDVKMITQRRPDSFWNGTLIGAGVGAGVGAVILRSFCGGDYDCAGNPREVAGYVGLYSGIGAAIGAGIDALIKSNQTIYLGATPSFSEPPRPETDSQLLSKRRLGVLVVLSRG